MRVKVLLATLPGETHIMGLHMVALKAVLAGVGAWNLGGPTPPEEILSAARTLQPVAVGITVTRYSAGTETTDMLNLLRDDLDPSIELWIGGGGASDLTDLHQGIRILTDPVGLQRVLEEFVV